MVARKTAEIAKVENLSDISSWDSALQYLAERGYDVRSSQETAELLGDGFTFVQDKSQLINRRFIIVDFKAGMSTNFVNDEGSPIPMVSVWAITPDGTRFKFVDMSSGVARELLEAHQRGVRPQGMTFEGLKPSDYDVRDQDGNPTGKKGRTYYCDNG